MLFFPSLPVSLIRNLLSSFAKASFFLAVTFMSQTTLAAPCSNRQELTARQPGVVSRYLVSDGQAVRKGDLLVGAMEAAEANVTLAKDAVKRLEKLKGTDSIADNQLVETQIRLLQANALLKQASGAHERVRIQLEDTRIRAVLSGTVRGLPNVLGLAVQAGQSLGRIESANCSN